MISAMTWRRRLAVILHLSPRGMVALPMMAFGAVPYLLSVSSPPRFLPMSHRVSGLVIVACWGKIFVMEYWKTERRLRDEANR